MDLSIDLIVDSPSFPFFSLIELYSSRHLELVKERLLRMLFQVRGQKGGRQSSCLVQPHSSAPALCIQWWSLWHAQVKIHNGIKKRKANTKYLRNILPAYKQNERLFLSHWKKKSSLFSHLGIRKRDSSPSSPKKLFRDRRAVCGNIQPTTEPRKWQDRCGLYFCNYNSLKCQKKNIFRPWGIKLIFPLYKKIFLDVELNYTPQSCNLLVIGTHYFHFLNLYFLELLLLCMFYWNCVIHWALTFQH